MGEDLVVARVARGDVLHDHHAGIQAALLGQEGRQLAESRVDEARDPPLGEAREDRHAEGDVIEGHRERLRVEVPSADARPLREDERVVRRGVHLDTQGGGRVLERRAHGPQDLWHATQGVRVLHFVRTFVGRDNLAPPQEASQVRGDLSRPGLRLQPDETIVERLRGTSEGLEGHRGGHLGVLQQPQAIVHDDGTDRRHHGRPVDDREAFLGLEDEGIEFRIREGLRPGKNLSVDLRLALADEHEAEVRQGGEVAARTERASGRDYRMDAAVQEIQEARHEDPTDAGVAHRERVRPEQESGPHLIPSERRAQADRVAPQQVELQRPDVRVGDGDVREFTEARLDPVRE